MIYDNENIFKEKSYGKSNKKRPKLLSVLLILSSIFILSSLSTVTQKLINGPLSQVQLEQQISETYASKAALISQGADQEFIHATEKIIENTKYINNEIFYLSNGTVFSTLIIGLISIILMFFKVKSGLYIYMIYSALPIITMYLTTPSHLILHTSMLMLAATALLFILMYSLSFKKIKLQERGTTY